MNEELIQAFFPRIPVQYPIENTSHDAVPFRSNGVRSDCYPNNPIEASLNTVRHDAPFALESEIKWDGTLQPPASNAYRDEPARPFIGMLNPEVRNDLGLGVQQGKTTVSYQKIHAQVGI